ncbi:MAG: NrtA/SsuA/CpmA family ABC transporter substrate-binding protein [Patescibacteria group bacterium]|nr:MAG: NrtA/SsuA/CpmA family ABC transporter substrate-binding protein [Patescibacteria group bacterium]
MRFKKPIFIIALVVASLLGVGILAQKQSFTPVETLRLGFANESLDGLILIAQSRGFFAEEGLEVTISEYASGKLALQAMFGGEVDMSPVAEVPIVFNSFKRNDFSIIATIGAADKHMTVIARKDSGIEEPFDLRGKRLATQEASALHFFSSVFLLHNGLSEGDVERSFKRITELVPALIVGEVDAVAVIEPFTTEAKELLGENATFFTPSGIYAKTWSLLAFNDFIEGKPRTVEKLLRALMRAEAFLTASRDQSIGIIAEGLDVEESWVSDNLDRLNLGVSLDQSYLTLLEDVARWAITNRLTQATEVPNYLNFMYMAGMETVDPAAVTVIR